MCSLYYVFSRSICCFSSRDFDLLGEPTSRQGGVSKWVVALEVILSNERTYTSIGSTQTLKMNVAGECMYVSYA